MSAYARPSSDEFHPACPHCRYDLGGLREGPCPECGVPFTIDDLRARHGRGGSDPRGAALAAGWTLAWCLVVVLLRSLYGDGQVGVVILIWIWASFAWVFRFEAARIPLLALASTAIPAALCTLVASAVRPGVVDPRGFEGLPILLLAGLGATTIAWTAVRTRRGASIVVACGGVLIGAGVVVLCVALAAMLRGRAWSGWPDMRWWQPYNNYPFTNTEACAIGAASTLTGAGACLGLVAASRRANARRRG